MSGHPKILGRNYRPTKAQTARFLQPIKTRHKLTASTSTRCHFAFGPCCHSNETRAPTANPSTVHN